MCAALSLHAPRERGFEARCGGKSPEAFGMQEMPRAISRDELIGGREAGFSGFSLEMNPAKHEPRRVVVF